MATTVQLWRRLGFEQKVAAVASILLIVSTFGPFSLVEAGVILTALGVLALLRARANGRRFHLPFGDGTVILAAAGWAALLIVTRLFDRPFGQNVLALACAALLAAAGLRERAIRPPDDVPGPAPGARAGGGFGARGGGARHRGAGARSGRHRGPAANYRAGSAGTSAAGAAAPPLNRAASRGVPAS